MTKRADPEAHLALAALFVEAKQLGEAEKILDTARAKFPEDVPLAFQHGAVLDQEKRHADAERVFRHILDRDPRHAPTLNYLGYMLAERGERLQESVGFVQRALEIDPHNGAYLDSLGWAYFKLRQWDLAEPSLREASEQLTMNSVVQDHFGDLMFELGRYGEAVAAWRRSLAGDGESIVRDQIKRKIELAQEKTQRK
ncbi:MAG: tetratricopeptide repeat protein [Acidobacteria bacterium]|nr:tetratricopeptide repeat protein [Acidobacteriota bacterium]